MTKLSGIEMRKALAKKLADNGRANDVKALRCMVEELQKSYSGSLLISTPFGASRTPGMTDERWFELVIFGVLDSCERHNRKPEQVWAALDVALAR